MISSSPLLKLITLTPDSERPARSEQIAMKNIFWKANGQKLWRKQNTEFGEGLKIVPMSPFESLYKSWDHGIFMDFENFDSYFMQKHTFRHYSTIKILVKTRLWRCHLPIGGGVMSTHVTRTHPRFLAYGSQWTPPRGVSKPTRERERAGGSNNRRAC